MQLGKIRQVLGPVVDVTFEGAELPPIYTALKVTNKFINDQEHNLTLEVAQHLGDSVCERSLWIQQGLVRGTSVLNTGQRLQLRLVKKLLVELLTSLVIPLMRPDPLKQRSDGLSTDLLLDLKIKPLKQKC